MLSWQVLAVLASKLTLKTLIYTRNGENVGAYFKFTDLIRFESFEVAITWHKVEERVKLNNLSTKTFYIHWILNAHRKHTLTFHTLRAFGCCDIYTNREEDK